MTEITKSRSPLTAATWETVTDGQYLTAKVIESKSLGWAEESDLAYEMAKASGLPVEWFRVLISSLRSGMPVVMTYDHGTEVVTQTVVVEYLSLPNWRMGVLQGTFYYKAWGFSGTRWYANLRGVKTPEVITEYK